MKINLILLLLTGSFVLDCARGRVAQDIEVLRNLTIADLQDLSVDAVGGCKIKVRNDLSDPQPIFIVPNKSEFWPIDNEGHISINSGDSVELFCPANFAAPFDTTKNIIATCTSGRNFIYAGKELDLKTFVCRSWPSFTARKMGRSCNGGILVESGFVVGTRFMRQMEICFNEKEEATRYVYHTLEPGSDFYQTAVPRVTFTTAGFFGGKNVDQLYTQKKQQETISQTLGADSSQYFDQSKSFFLARGHLGAKADFIYGSQQRATFLFVNAAPQWQRFNAGNWQKVEDSVRTMVSQRQTHLDCYTGTWGVTTLPNVQGQDTPLYLHYDANNNGQIPVPKLYFRVVIEPKTKKGVVLIGVNNPHLTLSQIQKDYIICSDVSNKIQYVNWKKTDIPAGYSYACEVNEFRKVVTHLPAFDVNGLLV